MAWVALFSGGKDSSWALYQALESAREVSHLLTVHPADDSYMYHVPATRLASLAAESIGLPLVEVSAEGIDLSRDASSGEHGDREIAPLEAALRTLSEETRIDGLVVGAVESAFQTKRIEGLAERLDTSVFSPLWQQDPVDLAESMLAAGFEIRIIQVAAGGLGPEWLGRTLDRGALSELQELSDRYGVHVLGEGGEFETLVTDGPHMTSPICLETERVWEGTRGHEEIRDAWLGTH